jgi:hypothetical protein
VGLATGGPRSFAVSHASGVWERVSFAEPSPRARRRVCQVRMLRSEVEVLSRDPDRGNPTLTRQGRGPELTGWSPVRLVALRGLP